MDINEFQNKLKDIQTLALNNGKQVRADLVEKFFGEEGMDQDKLQKVYDYLEVQGIHVTGRKEEESRKQEEAVSVRKKRESVPLTSEEEEYLRDYLKTFGFEDNLLDRQELLRRCAAGEASARESLIRTCQRELTDIAREMNCEEVLFADLLGEANMAFLSALDTLEEAQEERLEESLWREVRRLLEEFLEEQTRQKKEDHFLVEKVQNLEEKLKSITEDGNIKYTIEELSAFLDMDTEEMEAILRLTGDETGKSGPSK